MIKVLDIKFNGLWQHADFMKMWIGETISLFGSQISGLALPLTAVLFLNVGPSQMGVLNAMQFAPFLFLTLFTGVYIDRHRRRPVLILSNLFRAVLVAAIPILALFGILAIEQLYIIGFSVGVLTVFFDVAYQSYLPSLVDRRSLIEANSKLGASASAAQIGGPGIAGVLTELLSAPIALVADALSFLFSAFMLSQIRTEEPRTQFDSEKRNVLAEIKAGLQVTFGNAYLRPIAAEAATYNLSWAAMEAVFILYATRELQLSPAIIGLIISVGSISALLGAVFAAAVAKRFGFGRAIIYAMALGCGTPLLVPLASGSQPLVIAILTMAHFFGGFGVAISNVHVVSLRQTITPDHLLGRMNASYRTVIFGALPLGSLLGGFLGESIGLRPTLWLAAVGFLLALLWVIFSPVGKIEKLSDLA